MVCIFLQNNWVCEDDDMPNYVEMVFWCGNIAGFLLWGYTNDRYASLMFEKKLLSLRKSRLFSRVKANLLQNEIELSCYVIPKKCTGTDAPSYIRTICTVVKYNLHYKVHKCSNVIQYVIYVHILCRCSCHSIQLRKNFPKSALTE